MRSAPWIVAIILLVPAASPSVAAPEAAPASSGSQWSWTGVPRVVALGDLHGSSDKLVRLLRGTGLVDAELHWVAGTDHLVVAGDFLDRGVGDRPVMDLLLRLERESEASGGRVHVLLGNHEVMNLLRDTRKVHPESYRDFADDETSAERRTAWTGFAKTGSQTRALEELGAEFHRRFPRGFFARQRLLGAEGHYGSWLLGRPSIVRINGIVFLHGGLTEDAAELGLEGINRGVTEALTRHLDARDVLEREGVVVQTMRLPELLAAAEEVLEEPVALAEVRTAARGLVETADDPLLGAKGPLWYRGSSLEDERIERRMLERSLDLAGARAMVVAHSYTGGNRITSRFHGRLYRLDHGILQSDRPLALVVEQDEVLVLDPFTQSRTRPIRELPSGGVAVREATAITDPELERFLSEAHVIDSRDLARGSTRPRLLRLRRNGNERRGIYKTVEELDPSAAQGTDRYQHEVAAYRVDRMIGLGLVPVTVLRDIGGENGSLQFWVEEAVDQKTAADYGLSLGDASATADQLARGAVFDALIGNHHRRPSDILTLVSGKNVYLIDHSKAFSTWPELPARGSLALAVPSNLAATLRALDRPSLVAQLGELLSERQVDALLERRERILELTSASAGPTGAPPLTQESGSGGRHQYP
jgi:hypothetical protein